MLSDGSAVTLDLDELAFINPTPPGDDHEAHQQDTLVDRRPRRTPAGFARAEPVAPDAFNTHTIFKEIINLYLTGNGQEPSYDDCRPLQAAMQMQAPSLDAALREAARSFHFPEEVFRIMDEALRQTAREVLESLPAGERERVHRGIKARYDAEHAPGGPLKATPDRRHP